MADPRTIAGASFSNTPPGSQDISAQSFTSGIPSVNSVVGADFDDGPAWALDELAGGLLVQKDADGVQLNSYVISGNSAINSSGVLTITVGEDWAPWESSPVYGTKWEIEAPDGYLYAAVDTDLGTDGAPFSGNFIRIGILADSRTITATSFDSAVPAAATVTGATFDNTPPSAKTL